MQNISARFLGQKNILFKANSFAKVLSEKSCYEDLDENFRLKLNVL
jgi:hypothetical protein